MVYNNTYILIMVIWSDFYLIYLSTFYFSISQQYILLYLRIREKLSNTGPLNDEN